MEPDVVDSRRAKMRDQFTQPAVRPRTRSLKRLVPEPLRYSLRRSLTAAAAPVERRKVRGYLNRSPLRLHLACGLTRKEGWVNIDLLGVPVDMAWNLESGLPFPDASVDSVFHEHLIEHIPTEATYHLTRECLRVLRPGGVLRVAVPDAGLCLRSYAGQAESDWAESRATPMMSVESLFYEHKHVAMYDAEKLTLLLEVCGLTDVAERRYQDSQICPSPDSAHRAGGTLYVEGVRPPSN